MAEMTSFDSVDVLIQGGGIGGLTTAVALQRQGYRVRVIEKASVLSEVGAGIWMAPNPMQVFKVLGLDAKVKARGWDIHKMILQDSTGAIISISDLQSAARQFGFETTAIHRGVLQALLAEELAPDTITFSNEVVEFSQASEHVDVTLRNGERLRCRLLLGADGLHSPIRDQLGFSSVKRYSGMSSYRAVVTIEESLTPSLNEGREIWAPGCRLGFSRISANQYYWYLTFSAPAGQSKSQESRFRHAQELFEKHFKEWLPLINKAVPSQIIPTDISDLKPLEHWVKGRVGLLGDAAHATTPNLGQGGAMAVEDALALVGSIQSLGLNPQALVSFQKRRQEKVQWTVSTSWQIGQVSHWENPWARTFRNWVLRNMPERVNRQQWQKLYQVEALKQS